MEKFKKKAFKLEAAGPGDAGVKVSTVLKLLEGSEFYEKLYALLEIDKITDDFIEIPGARTLVQKILAKENEFVKLDIELPYSSLGFTKGDDEEFRIIFNDVEHERVSETQFVAEPIYSAKNEFFANLYNMDKYANSLLGKGLGDIVLRNLEMLKPIIGNSKEHQRVYRVLKDNEGFYLRGIVSPQYNDYNNKITIAIGLIELHKESLRNGTTFTFKNCEYNESFVRAFFEKEETQVIKKLGKTKYVIEISNDEVRREALRFTGVLSLIFDYDNNKQGEIYIKPKEHKSEILSIRHNITPERAIKELSSFGEYRDIENDLHGKLRQFAEVKEPDQIKYLILQGVKNVKSGNELSQYKDKIYPVLSRKADTIHALLDMVNKVQLIVEDIDAKEYLRYLIYDAFINRRGEQD